MNQLRAIYLTGFMGAGKSTVGKELARKLGYAFIDLDATIELISGSTITELFLQQGETGFRKMETEVLKELHNKAAVVIATGGGCGANPENVELMKQSGSVIYLKVQPGMLFHRLAPQKMNRPLISNLSDVQLMEFIQALLALREGIYATADLTVNGDNEVSVVCEEILKKGVYQSLSGLLERTS